MQSRGADYGEDEYVSVIPSSDVEAQVRARPGFDEGCARRFASEGFGGENQLKRGENQRSGACGGPRLENVFSA